MPEGSGPVLKTGLFLPGELVVGSLAGSFPGVLVKPDCRDKGPMVRKVSAI
jgi:hypothetical protein